MKQCRWIAAALLLSASAINASDQGKYFGPELLANYELVQVYAYMPGYEAVFAEALCPEGKVAIGGGVTQLSGGHPFSMFNGPTLEGDGWRVSMRNFFDPEPNEIIVSAICVDLIPSRGKPSE